MCLERGRLPLVAKVWHAPPEGGGGAPPYVKATLQKKTAIAKGGWDYILEKRKRTCIQENAK
jgi:hypothetical protein